MINQNGNFLKTYTNEHFESTEVKINKSLKHVN